MPTGDSKSEEVGFFSTVEKVTWEKAAPSLEPLPTLRRESHVTLLGPAFCTSQVLPHHLKKAKDWDRGWVGSLLRFCLSAARHPSIMKGLSWKDSWGYMKLPFTERALKYHTDLMLGHRDSFCLVLGKQPFGGPGGEAVN